MFSIPRHVPRLHRWAIVRRFLSASAIVVGGCRGDAAAPDRLDTPPTGADILTAADPVIVAAGDLVCGATTPAGNPCQHAAVAALIPAITPDAVLLLGDIQYEDGTLADFNARFHPAFGAYMPILFSVPGNHEYRTTGAKGYFDYFNGVGAATGRAGHRTQGFYSFNIGSWHVVVINSSCTQIGGCSAGSPMEQWLRADLAANPSQCTLAAWHHPRFSSGNHGSISKMQPIWQALYDFDAEVVLSGHDHDYERFAPQTATGAADPLRGLRQFVVGTGGKEHGLLRTKQPNSEVLEAASFGLLKLTLHPSSYSWSFVPVAGDTLNDAGTTACHGATAPPPVTTLVALAEADAYVVKASSTKNRGALTSIVVDSTPLARTFVRFAATGIGSRTVISAKLRLYSTDPSPEGGRVHVLADNSWGEKSLTYANAPTYDPVIVAAFGAVGANGWYEVDVTATIDGDGTYSFVLDSPDTDSAIYRSREGGAATAPRLVLTVQ